MKMELSKSFTNKNVRLVKLNYGEEVIGFTDGLAEDGSITLEKIIRVVVMPGNRATGAQPSIGFADFVPWVKEERMTFKAKDIMLLLTPKDEIVKEYKAMFSGIITPDSQTIKLPGLGS
jgi:hypothetical protein